jgi:hypothetical protein
VAVRHSGSGGGQRGLGPSPTWGEPTAVPQGGGASMGRRLGVAPSRVAYGAGHPRRVEAAERGGPAGLPEAAVVHRQRLHWCGGRWQHEGQWQREGRRR